MTIKQIFNMQKGPILLVKSGIKLKPGGSVEVRAVTEEMKMAEKRGLIKIGTRNATPPAEATPEKREWMIDYSKEFEGLVTVLDLSTGRKLTAKIEEKLGEQNYKLENIGSVNGQKYAPTSIAKDHFDGID